MVWRCGVDAVDTAGDYELCGVTQVDALSRAAGWIAAVGWKLRGVKVVGGLRMQGGFREC